MKQLQSTRTPSLDVDNFIGVMKGHHPLWAFSMNHTITICWGDSLEGVVRSPLLLTPSKGYAGKSEAIHSYLGLFGICLLVFKPGMIPVNFAYSSVTATSILDDS